MSQPNQNAALCDLRVGFNDPSWNIQQLSYTEPVSTYATNIIQQQYSIVAGNSVTINLSTNAAIGPVIVPPGATPLAFIVNDATPPPLVGANPGGPVTVNNIPLNPQGAIAGRIINPNATGIGLTTVNQSLTIANISTVVGSIVDVIVGILVDTTG